MRWAITQNAYVKKYGLEPDYWNRYVFRSYHHHQHDAVFLAGIPDMIKEEMSEWVGTVERYDDPDITDPKEIWGL